MEISGHSEPPASIPSISPPGSLRTRHHGLSSSHSVHSVDGRRCLWLNDFSEFQMLPSSLLLTLKHSGFPWIVHPTEKKRNLYFHSVIEVRIISVHNCCMKEHFLHLVLFKGRERFPLLWYSRIGIKVHFHFSFYAILGEICFFSYPTRNIHALLLWQ